MAKVIPAQSFNPLLFWAKLGICRLLGEVFRELEQAIKPGISTMDINNLGDKLIRKQGCVPNFLHYQGYPASICVSVNEEVVHGIPRKERILKEGDIVSLDAGLIYKGFHSDMARTFGVGKISEENIHGGNTGLNCLFQFPEHFAEQTAGSPHQFNFPGRFN